MTNCIMKVCRFTKPELRCGGLNTYNPEVKNSVDDVKMSSLEKMKEILSLCFKRGTFCYRQSRVRPRIGFDCYVVGKVEVRAMT